MDSKSYIGLDCGGTQCRIAWTNGERRVDFIGKGANYTTNPRACAEAIAAAAQSLADKAKVPLDRICTARGYAGVAGVMTEGDAEALRRDLPLADVQIEDDRRAQVVGALGPRDGFVAALGTGSFFARRAGSNVHSLGGWGLNLGDEASGAWLGRGLLQMALQAHDGLIPHSPLTEAVLDEFGGPTAIVDFARDAVPAEYARLAPGLAGAASAGDPQGRRLMTEGAVWIERALRTLGWRRGARLCLPGRLGEAFRPFLSDDLRVSLQEVQGTSLDGALALARARDRNGAA